LVIACLFRDFRGVRARTTGVFDRFVARVARKQLPRLVAWKFAEFTRDTYTSVPRWLQKLIATRFSRSFPTGHHVCRMSNSRLIAIGDVHGCVHALDTLLKAIAPEPSDTLVFLGDLIDQGYESREVLNTILKLQDECQVVLIEGNHEAMLFAARDNLKAQR